MSDAQDGPQYDALLRLNTVNPSSDKIHVNFFQDGSGDSTKRENCKAWWKKCWPKLNRWNVIEQWAEVYKAEVDRFEAAFEHVVAHTSARIKKKEKV